MTTDSSEDQLTRMKVNVSLNSTESPTEKVKVHRAPVVAKAEKRTYCERHPRVCKAGRIAGATALVGLAVAATPEALIEAPLELGVEAYKKRKAKRTPKTMTVKAPTKTEVKKKSPSKPKSATKKTTTKAPVKKKPASKKSTKKESSVKQKTKSKTTTKKKSSSRKDDLSYWRI